MKHTYKVYYGAGRRYLPQNGFHDYDLILVDSEEQKRKAAARFPKIRSELFFKPAAENVFIPIECEKKYHVCFSAIHPSDERKRVEWVYDTVPRHLSVIQLGNMPKFKVPNNVRVKPATRKKVAKYINQSCVGIAPYTKDDSGPRILSEFLACGLPVVASKSVRFWDNKFFPFVVRRDKKDFWNAVEGFINYPCQKEKISQYYQENLSLELAAAHIRSIFAEGTTW